MPRFRIPRPLAITFVMMALYTNGWSGTATSVTGLFYTGVNNSGTALGDGATDSHWSVSYARVNGSGSTSSAYTGASYVVSGTYIDGAWVPNSSTYRWITAPGASTTAAGTTINTGGDFLPGNGTTNANSAYYVYRLAFTVDGTGAGTAVTNSVSITLTIAADDQYSVYVNPASAPTVANNGTINTGGTAASGSRTGAWNNTTALTLANGAGGNANFVVGTNYLYIVVANTNSKTGNDPGTALNPSGLLVYQVGSATLIDGNPVPEVGAWLPVAASLGLFSWTRMRRRREKQP